MKIIDSFTSSFLCLSLLLLILALSYSLSPVQCWIEGIRGNNFALKGKQQFSIRLYVCPAFFINAFIRLQSSLNFILRWDFFSWTCGEFYQLFFLHLLTWSHNFSPLFFDVVNYIDWFFDTLPNCITLLGHYVLSSLYTAICLNLFRIILLMFMRFMGSIVLFFVLPLSSFGMKAFLDS